MGDVFHIPPAQSSLVLAVATGLTTVLYAPASALVHRLGAARVLQGGLALRTAALAALLGVALVSFVGRDWTAVVIFVALALAWPFVSIASTVLTSAISPVGEGEGMGIYNATAGLSNLIGAVLGGAVAHWGGYHAVLILGAVSIALSLLLALPIQPVRRDRRPASPPPAHP